LLDCVAGVPNLGDALRASKVKKYPSAPTSIADLPGGEEENWDKSTTTLAGGEDALVDLSLIPAFGKAVIPQLNYTASFPPSHVMHGVEYDLVKTAESIQTYDQLKALGAEVEMILTTNNDAGGGHMFEWGREDVPEVKKVTDKISNFLVKHSK
jgi:hypothetical protein